MACKSPDKSGERNVCTGTVSSTSVRYANVQRFTVGEVDAVCAAGQPHLDWSRTYGHDLDQHSM